MKVLLFTPVPCPTLERVLRQSPLQIECCDTLDRALFLLSTDRFSAVVARFTSINQCTQATGRLATFLPSPELFVVLPREVAVLEDGSLTITPHTTYFEPFLYSRLLADVCLAAYQQREVSQPRCSTNNFTLDLLSRTAYFKQKVLHLTRTEFDLLALLVRKQGIVLTRTQIWEAVWGYDEYPLANTVDVHVSRLRRKLPQEGGELIQTVYGIGYRLGEEA